MGAHFNGYTSREQTAFYIKALSKDMPKGRMASGGKKGGVSPLLVYFLAIGQGMRLLLSSKLKMVFGSWREHYQEMVL